MTLKHKCFENVSDQRMAIIAEAREWIDTPYHHQAGIKGVGCDCIGLVAGVAFELDLAHCCDNHGPEWEKYHGYSMTPDPRLMRQGLTEFMTMIKKDDAEPGDVLWLRSMGGALGQHLAILTDVGTIVHAYRMIGRVVETRMTDMLEQARMLAAWRYPKVEC